MNKMYGLRLDSVHIR